MSSSNPASPEWKCGDTFLYRRSGLDNHLQIVLSDPSLDAAKVVVVNFSSWEPYKEQACIVEPGEHPFVVKRTCVPYRFAATVTLAFLEDRESRGHIAKQQPLSAALLARVLAGAAQSRFMPTEVWDVIEVQDLVEPF
jgi:hypothetical protein